MSMKNGNSYVASVYYKNYDKKKGGKSKSVAKNNNSTDDKKCFQCRYAFEQEHLKSCPAKDTECRFSILKGHFTKCCSKAGKFLKGGAKNSISTEEKDDSQDPKKEHSLHIAQHTQEYENTTEFYDEDRFLHVVHKPQ